eukprot:gnl/Chilomastix_caulleri/1590.p1 GENE.gnl/Chilomastix_caulleri/1590~~gnl/Chilomastix_caulleri/1590.p1  ORF type:complete len:103 (+),score=20.34 gnl/Chilomastix_caulleri/1590:38-310(+)
MGKTAVLEKCVTSLAPAVVGSVPYGSGTFDVEVYHLRGRYRVGLKGPFREHAPEFRVAFEEFLNKSTWKETDASVFGLTGSRTKELFQDL